ncbi:pyridoxal phosphate-dependent aminotransferase [Aestuariivirga litoralis]|uniref:aspartate transaminase n=1 Tax=Aestuariivirga litoralis TaxID=2650924 RepID=A0A2W2BR88_9HYPH|nr:pyridoxal phosphate-dependent aminotransferase [Aestuariivirga litoralis]PZF78739.1 pyridoxal phosphate-dependent aminotransferase [Aestuariivirga litoralis]
MLKINPAVAAIEEETAFTVMDRANALRAQGHPVINLGIGQPDFQPPKHILEAAEKAVRDGPHGYTSPQGLPALRDAVAQYVGGRFKVPVTGDEVVIVPGGKVTFYFACQIFGGPGAEILYPDPGFPPYRDAARSSGAKPVPYPIREEKDFGFDAEEVLSLITPATRLIIINSPANPTGGVVSRAEITRLAHGLAKHPNVAVLSDEIYSHQVYDGVDFVSFLSFPELRDRTIILDGWSKTFAMTGWRLGFGIWPKHLIEYVKKLITVDHSCTSVATQMGGLAAITGPMDEIEDFRKSFQKRRDMVVTGLNDIKGVRCRVPGGAFYAFPNITGTGWQSRDLARELLDKAYVALIFGESFGQNGKGFMRLSYAASEADLAEALKRMKAFIEA